MGKIEKLTFDELEKIMELIPKSEQIQFLGEGGVTLFFSDKSEMENYIRCICNTVEVSYVQFADGTWAIYEDEKNTGTASYTTLAIKNGYTTFQGQVITKFGHTHVGDYPISDYDTYTASRFIDITHYVYYALTGKEVQIYH